MQSIITILKDVGIPVQTGQVYVALLRQKRATARQLAEAVGIPRPSVYDHLKVLTRHGLVTEFAVENKKFFQPEDAKGLRALLRDTREAIQAHEKALDRQLPELLAGSGGVEPRIKFYEGSDAFLRALNDILWFPKERVCAVWPFSAMTEVAGDEELKRFTARRVAEKITIRSVWFRENAIPDLAVPLESTRIAPRGTSSRMGYVVYGDRVAFISSKQESFAFIVTSRDFADLSRMQFELLWRMSRPRGK